MKKANHAKAPHYFQERQACGTERFEWCTYYGMTKRREVQFVDQVSQLIVLSVNVCLRSLLWEPDLSI